MSGPGGTKTRRDQRRNTRRAQYEERVRQRQLETQRRLRRQRMQRYAIYAATALVVILIGVLIFTAVHGASGGAKSSGPVIIHGTGTQTQPAAGQTIDGMKCDPNEQVAQHIHAYLLIYVNGQQYTVPGATGIPAGANCIYPLHVHDGQDNIIHVESPDPTAVYTLGAFFDIWGEPLNATQMAGFKADAQHQLVFEVFDANGKLTKWTNNPLDLQIKAHETIVILYNSPNVTPQPYTTWGSL